MIYLTTQIHPLSSERLLNDLQRSPKNGPIRLENRSGVFQAEVPTVPAHTSFVNALPRLTSDEVRTRCPWLVVHGKLGLDRNLHVNLPYVGSVLRRSEASEA